MKETKFTRTVPIEVTRYTFEASNCGFHRSLTIENGEIVETGCWDSRNGGGCSKGDPEFESVCRDSIRFITKYEPSELKNIYKCLSEGRMKDFCRALQQEKIAELQLETEKLDF